MCLESHYCYECGSSNFTWEYAYSLNDLRMEQPEARILVCGDCNAHYMDHSFKKGSCYRKEPCSHCCSENTSWEEQEEFSTGIKYPLYTCWDCGNEFILADKYEEALLEKEIV